MQIFAARRRHQGKMVCGAEFQVIADKAPTPAAIVSALLVLKFYQKLVFALLSERCFQKSAQQLRWENIRRLYGSENSRLVIRLEKASVSSTFFFTWQAFVLR